MASSDLVDWSNPLSGILSSVLGGETTQDINKSGAEKTTSQQATTGATTGTTQQNQTGTNNQTTTSNADVGALQQILAKQQAGITPEMLSALFTEGSKKIPALTTSYANAVGARASDNSPLATSLRDLQTNLTNQAATLNNQLLSDASGTAAKIADLTKSTSTTGSQTQTGTTNQNTSTNGTTNTGTDVATHSDQQLTEKKSVNSDNLKLLAGLGIGGSLLDSLLGGNGTTGGLTSLISQLTGVGGTSGNGGLLGGLVKLITGKTGGNGSVIDSTGSTNDSNPDLNGSVGDIGTADWYNQQLADLGIDPKSLGDFSTGLSNEDLASIIDGNSAGDYTSWFNDLGWANGGLVTSDKMTAQPVYRAVVGNSPPQSVAGAGTDNRAVLLRRISALKALQSDPKGRQLLQLANKQRAANVGSNPSIDGSGASNSAPGTAPSSPTAQGIAVGNAVGNAVGSTVLSMVNPALAPLLAIIGIHTPQSAQSQIAKFILSQLQGKPAASTGSAATAAPTASVTASNMSFDAPVSQEAQAISDAATAAANNAPSGVAGNEGNDGSNAGSGSASGVGAGGDGSGGATGAGVGGDGAGNGGGDGGSGGGAGGTGWSGGGMVSEEDAEAGMPPDPEGVGDTVQGRLSVGEFVNTNPVVKALGVDFFHHLEDRFGRSNEMTRAMGINQ